MPLIGANPTFAQAALLAPSLSILGTTTLGYAVAIGFGVAVEGNPVVLAGVGLVAIIASILLTAVTVQPAPQAN